MTIDELCIEHLELLKDQIAVVKLEKESYELLKTHAKISIQFAQERQ